MINKCDNCTHSKVCIYKQKYQENYTLYQENFTFLEDDFKQDEFFSIELDCKEYESNKPINYELIKPKNLILANSCEGCNIYEDMKKGKFVVNDACSFCSKFSLKVGD